MANRIYICIDFKSFYASVECVERNLDPMTANLVVADPERSEKTICLAVSPSMKALGVKNRCRVFEIPKTIEYIMAPPRMQHYIDCSTEIYGIYLKYVAKEDIHVYSIDEAFLDVTDYLTMYQMSARDLGSLIMKDILDSTGIPSSCGIGTNLYLAKIALDITAKHAKDRIGMLEEETYREKLWDYRPLNDFWRVGAGTVKRLEQYGIYTMGQIAHAQEDLLYKVFGVDAELLIDHAWGRESTTIADIKAYKARSNCLTSGQVLSRDYDHEEGRLIVKEMMDLLCLELVDKGLVTDSVTLQIGYSNALKMDAARGTVSLTSPSSASRIWLPKISQLYDQIKDPMISMRRVNVSCNRVVEEGYTQYDIFMDPAEMEKEQKIQKAMLGIKKKFGKNAILKGMNLEEGATTLERNKQIGGHRSGE